MTDAKRLIEVAFPLKQASIDSVHEKNVRHGHISTLHIWPARRPLAACRAALVATLLPDPGDDQERTRLLKRLGGEVVEVVKKKKLPNGRVEEQVVQETVGGILHWGRESSPDLEWFRKRIREAYGGRAPRVLDPFAGGGAIPLEAMRLGCEVTAADINPVAWFILKCTLDYPQRLAGQSLPLPEFALESPEFMASYFKGTGKPTRKQLERNLQAVQQRLFPETDADLAWHVRAWGWWVLQQARKQLAHYYPTYAELEPLKPHMQPKAELGELRLVALNDDGTADVDALNADFDAGHMAAASKPRWVAKHAVAYLWARTVTCKGCRATIPLLKTRWLCKKGSKRVLLTLTPNTDKTAVVFGIERDVPVEGRNAAQRREHDRRLGQGTMARPGAWCPCCGRPGTVAMRSEDIRQEGLAGRLGTAMTAVVVDGQGGKEYRLPTELEVARAEESAGALGDVYRDVPFGAPDEPVPQGASREGGGSAFTTYLYGLREWSSLFTPRQLLSLGHIVRAVRLAHAENKSEESWTAATTAYLYACLSRLADRNSQLCTWQPNAEKIGHTFARFALPITWDFVEVMPWADSSGGFLQAVEWVAKCVEHLALVPRMVGGPLVLNRSAIDKIDGLFDVIMTDPPYYDAIPYSDLMDFFYVWLRRTVHDMSPETERHFANKLCPKWDSTAQNGELIDDASRFGGNKGRSKDAYEEGMYRAFCSLSAGLRTEGRLVVVFANKQPEAWETLVAAIIRSGFIVDGSWPIQTERKARTRSLGSAALSSSVWLVCRKRSDTARPGWDTQVLQLMRDRIADRLTAFWDAGIRGPDFVWAATGPALEAYSQHPVVKKTNDPGQLLTVPEFLRSVRRMVVEYIVGRVLSHNGGADSVAQLDDATTYYLLHRNDFGLGDAPAGACILYAISCGLSDRDLEVQLDLISRSGKAAAADEGDEEDQGDEGAESGGGSTFKLKPWHKRTRRTLGLETAGGRATPLIDQVHRLMHLWKTGDVTEVDHYLEARGLRANRLFPQVVQALIELANAGSSERALLESLANRLKTQGAVFDRAQERLEGM